MNRPPNSMQRKTPHWAEAIVRLLDDGLRIPGTKIGVGLDALIGFFLPGVGDTLTAVSGLSLFYAAYKQGVPARVLARMAMNMAIDLGVGVIPVVGDGFDLLWKSNRKNLDLIERHRNTPETPEQRRRDLWILGFALLGLLISIVGVLFVLFVTLRWIWQGLLSLMGS